MSNVKYLHARLRQGGDRGGNAIPCLRRHSLSSGMSVDSDCDGGDVIAANDVVLGHLAVVAGDIGDGGDALAAVAADFGHLAPADGAHCSETGNSENIVPDELGHLYLAAPSRNLEAK